ncbi:MAG TPA: class I SAM-dependent methyltransferase, partial [Ferruginibacter sp.]|nr:class I SAM-dependent methyltransferase [Ferruginibacter sp.]
GRVLDIGCGTGAFLNNMQAAGWDVTGLEPDEKARMKAMELYNIDPSDPTKLFDLSAGAYDAVTMWHVLEHVHNLHGYMKKISELLSSNGRLFIAVPNYTSYDARHYKTHWAAWDVPRHLYHFSPASMETLLDKHNLRLIAVRPMWYDSFYVSMLSEKYKNGKGNLVKAVWNGFLSNLKAIGDKRKCSSVIYVIGSK